MKVDNPEKKAKYEQAAKKIVSEIPDAYTGEFENYMETCEAVSKDIEGGMVDTDTTSIDTDTSDISSSDSTEARGIENDKELEDLKSEVSEELKKQKKKKEQDPKPILDTFGRAVSSVLFS